VLAPEARNEAVRLLEGARRDGLLTVLIAESIAPIADAFARVLAEEGPSFDLVVANQLELDAKLRATGELIEPVLAPEVDPRRVRELAARARDRARGEPRVRQLADGPRAARPRRAALRDRARSRARPGRA
jgi:phosphoserine phosphatase